VSSFSSNRLIAKHATGSALGRFSPVPRHSFLLLADRRKPDDPPRRPGLDHQHRLERAVLLLPAQLPARTRKAAALTPPGLDAMIVLLALAASASRRCRAGRSA
jgi:hypothetical protein